MIGSSPERGVDPEREPKAFHVGFLLENSVSRELIAQSQKRYLPRYHLMMSTKPHWRLPRKKRGALPTFLGRFRFVGFLTFWPVRDSRLRSLRGSLRMFLAISDLNDLQNETRRGEYGEFHYLEMGYAVTPLRTRAKPIRVSTSIRKAAMKAPYAAMCAIWPNCQKA